MKRLYNDIKWQLKFCLPLFLLLAAGCKKWIEVPAPVTSINTENVYANNATAAAVLTGIYAQISYDDEGQSNGFITDISVCAALSADELTLYDMNNPSYQPFYVNNLNSETSTPLFWNNIYPIIFQANSAIEGLNTSSGLNPAAKQQLLGEAYFVRAWCFFYLANLYGDVPLTLTTDYKTNESLGRSPKAQVFQQIIADLKQAQTLLSKNYLDATVLNQTSARVRPTVWAADALLAKVYLYDADLGNTSEFTDAYNQSSAVIANSTLFGLDPLNQAFLANSTETIWSLQPVNNVAPDFNTGEGALFVLPSTGPNALGNYPVYLSNNVVQAFEPGDQRFTNWVNSVTVGSTTYYYPYKYKAGAAATSTTENIMVLRLGEQYLIRAEAEANGAGGGISAAIADLNTIRTRAGLPGTTATDKTSLLTAIMHERQVELFTEWGNRWFDLQRSGTINTVMDTVAPQKGGTWSSYKALYPVPETDLLLDNQLKQNTGY